VTNATGRAKILGDPRSRSWAIEWMSTHLVEEFDTVQGDPLRCKTCHAGNVGSKEWNPRVILTDSVPGVPDAGSPPTPEIPSDAGVTDGG
jgi:hypothetical protein